MNAASAFSIARLTLTDFRNYEALRIDPPPGLIALAGANGAGKTNLLEAISLLMPGRGLRAAEFATIGRQQGSGAWAVSARVLGPRGESQLGTAWNVYEGEAQAQTQSQARAVLIDGQLQKSAGALAGHFSTIWLTPAMDRLFSGPAGDRRRYLDRLVALFDASHAGRASSFEKLMRERNALLAHEGPPDRAWLATLESQMAETAIAMAATRLQALAHLGTYLTPERLPGAFPWSRLSVEGEIEALVLAHPALAAEALYRETLARNRPQDKAMGRTLAGPHRSDLSVWHGPKNIPAPQGSTGEQKALLIGLVLAQTQAVRAVTGAAPVLLLDEVAAHLDRARREALFGQLRDMAVQVWMTGTERELFDGAHASTMVYQVDNGQLGESPGT